MKLMEYLRIDEELKQFREKWKEKFEQPFPPYNYDEYAGIDDYKKKIREALETGEYKKCLGKTASKFQGIMNVNR